MKLDPKKFFTNKFWLSDRFKELVQESSPTEPMPLYGSVLDTSRSDADLLEANGLVDLSSLAALLKKQPKGEEGSLLINGYANLFYVQSAGEVVVVGVCWRSDRRQWLVCAYRLDGYRWSAGYRVFSATAPGSPSTSALTPLESLTLDVQINGKSYIATDRVEVNTIENLSTEELLEELKRRLDE